MQCERVLKVKTGKGTGEWKLDPIIGLTVLLAEVSYY